MDHGKSDRPGNAPRSVSWRVPVIWAVLVCGWLALRTLPALAWEGHDWERWRAVTTWQRPALVTDQSGHRDLAPLLGSGTDVASRATSAADWAQQRERWVGALGSILGSPTTLERLPTEVRDLGVEEFDGYTRRHILIRSEVEDWIPAYLLVPRALAQARVPAVICQHQTVAQGKEEPCGIKGDRELAFALELVQRGFVCLAPDAIGFGERIPAGKSPYHDSLAFYRRHPGWSFFGKMIWDTGRAIDYLETLPFVDSTRIASIGHSHGAYGTLMATAFEPRIRAAVASCGFTTLRSDPNPERWSHLTALLPQLGFYLPDVASIPFDWQHVLALAAPRPLFVWYSTHDSIFPRTERLADLLWDVRGVYELHGQGDALRWQPYEGGHQFPRSGREQAYRWLAETLGTRPAPNATPAKSRSAFFPDTLVDRARTNARDHAWAAAIRDPVVAAAEPWMARTDAELWDLPFGNGIRRAWQVWSDGHCPACRQSVPMYEWIADALNRPWKLQCPRCREFFPKNDFARFHRSGLNEQGVFEARRADRSLLFNTDHPGPNDPLHGFGVDDGEGYVADGKRWRFVGAYLIYGQWKQAIVAGIRSLAAAYVATGDRRYAHRAGVLLDRVADVYPTFDFGREGVMYEGPPRAGYVSTWHDACVEVLDLALAYDQVFEALKGDAELVSFLSGQARRWRLANPKRSWADIQRNIEDRIFRDTLDHRPKIESNYPSTDVTLVTLRTVLEWPGNRAEVLALLDDILREATAVDGLTGEKGIAGYSLIGPHTIAGLLGRYARAEPGFLPEILRRHPRLQAMYRFHLETLCLGQYYPRTGDTGAYAQRTPGYAGLPFTRLPGVNPSSYSFLWELYQATGDPDFVRLLHQAGGETTNGLPYDLFAADPVRLQSQVAEVLRKEGADFRLGSVHKSEWALAVLRSGEGPQARAVWLDYDSGGRHGHADAMTLGLFAHGLDLLPDFGYPPVQYGGWAAPRAVWYTETAAHATVAVDGRNSRPGTGHATLWFAGGAFQVVRASAPELVGASRFERTVALIDVSPAQAYVVDLFRVAGGRQHAKYLHGPFGEMATTGLALSASSPNATNGTFRLVGQGPSPAPAAWRAEWKVEDRFKYLGAAHDIRLRYTDFSGPAEVATAESWVSVGWFDATGDAWIPSLRVRRQATEASLESTFVGVLEPFEDSPGVVAARRLELRTLDGAPCPEEQVALELDLVDGQRDLVVSARVEPAIGPTDTRPFPTVVTEASSGLSFEGDLGFVRRDAAGRPVRLALCRARALRWGSLEARSRDAGASFEIAWRDGRARVVNGPREAVESVRVDAIPVHPE